MWPIGVPARRSTVALGFLGESMKLIVVFFSLLLLSVSVSVSAETSIEGVKIGDGPSSLEKLSLTLTNSEKNEGAEIRKYKTKTGNELSITVQKDKVVYIEYDWSQDEESSKTPYDGFIFGKTALTEVRSRFGNNGFTHKRTAFVKSGNGLVTFNCYELVDSSSTIFVVVSKVVPKAGINAANIADHFKLDALILADPAYLDEIWGKEKAYDSAYKKYSF
jgi:hypothetical protein